MRERKKGKNPISLENDGDLTLFPVGSGSAFGKSLFQNNWLIIKGKDHVLIDCGTKAPIALHQLGLKITDIKTFLITHSHADHIGGLEEAMLMNRYVARKKASIVLTKTFQDVLWNFSLKGGAAFNEMHANKELQFADMWKIKRPKYMSPYPRETFEANIGKINIKLVRTRHFPEQAKSWETSFFSVGLIIDNRILFSGDTQFDPELIYSYDEIFHFEHIFHDAQLFTGGIHSSIDELTTLSPEIKSRMLLMHYQDTFKDHTEKVKKEGFLGFAKQWYFYTFPSTESF